jgi:hypothetical protein
MCRAPLHLLYDGSDMHEAGDGWFFAFHDASGRKSGNTLENHKKSEKNVSEELVVASQWDICYNGNATQSGALLDWLALQKQTRKRLQAMSEAREMQRHIYRQKQ